MDSTHLHLILNHFPIIGTLIAVGMMTYGYFTQSEVTKKAALLTWLAMAVIAIPVFLTGEPAEETVENLAGVSEALIEQHEEAAELAIWAMEALGVLSLITLFLGFRFEKFKKPLTGITLALGMITFGLMAYTGYIGGQIRHTEIRSGNTALVPANNGGEADDD